MTYTVYGIRCNETGRIYIGCTAKLDERIRTHFSELKRGAKTACYGPGTNPGRPHTQFQIDYDKYGKDAFHVYVLEVNVAPDNRRAREQYWITKYRATEPEYGYNFWRAKRELVMVEPGLPPLPPEKEDGA